MARRNVLAALVLLGLGAWYGVMTAALPARSLPNTPGPSFFPWLITAAVLALALALLVQGLAGRVADDGSEKPGAPMSRRALALAAFAVYLAALPYAGFIAASVAFFAAMMLLYGGRGVFLVAGVSVAVPVGLYLVFREVFQILLPRGGW